MGIYIFLRDRTGYIRKGLYAFRSSSFLRTSFFGIFALEFAFERGWIRWIELL